MLSPPPPPQDSLWQKHVYLKQYLIFCNPVKFLRLNAVFTGIRNMLTNYKLLDDNKDKYLQRRLMGLRVSWTILQFFFAMVVHLMISISFNECRVKSFVKSGCLMDHQGFIYEQGAIAENINNHACLATLHSDLHLHVLWGAFWVTFNRFSVLLCFLS